MSDRSLLGSADVTDEELTLYAARQLGLDPDTCTLEGALVEDVDYELEAITTGGRWWVTVDLGTPTGGHRVRFFVKLVHSWSRSPLFAQVPPEHREVAERLVPWRTEPLIYRSDLSDRLPPGLTMARAVDVRFLDEASAVVWLPEVDVVPWSWPAARLAHAAGLLGRLAASQRVRGLSGIEESDLQHGVRRYAEGRLGVQIGPMLHDHDLWRHPVLKECFGEDLRARLSGHFDRLPEYVDWLEAAPQGMSHGDACSNNLLVQPDSTDLVLIDYGFWGTQALGFDLSQLLVGDVQIGRRPAAELAGMEALCTPAYVEGLRAEGCDVPIEVVRRAHALQLLMFSGFSSFFFPELQVPPSPEVCAMAAERAAIARFAVDFVDATA
ncbi:MAG: phosphotransferase [Nostocoides sp.]